MNIQNQFPEIDNFFKKNKFSSVDLEDLKTTIENNYSSHSEQNMAMSIIKLNLLKFKLKKEGNILTNPIDKSVPKLSYYLKLSVKEICDQLEWKPERLISILSQRNILINENEYLTEHDLKKIKNLLDGRITAVKRQHKIAINNEQMHFRRHKSSKLAKGEGVYEKLGLFGPGKLIYIRSK